MEVLNGLWMYFSNEKSLSTATCAYGTPNKISASGYRGWFSFFFCSQNLITDSSIFRRGSIKNFLISSQRGKFMHYNFFFFFIKFLRNPESRIFLKESALASAFGDDSRHRLRHRHRSFIKYFRNRNRNRHRFFWLFFPAAAGIGIGIGIGIGPLNFRLKNFIFFFFFCFRLLRTSARTIIISDPEPSPKV